MMSDRKFFAGLIASSAAALLGFGVILAAVLVSIPKPIILPPEQVVTATPPAGATSLPATTKPSATIAAMQIGIQAVAQSVEQAADRTAKRFAALAAEREAMQKVDLQARRAEQAEWRADRLKAKHAIQRLMYADKLILGRIPDDLEGAKRSFAIAKYIREASQLPTRYCPEEFEEAYYEYLHVSSMAAFSSQLWDVPDEKRSPEQQFQSRAIGLLVLGEMAKARRTLERIAKTYGADLKNLPDTMRQPTDDEAAKSKRPKPAFVTADIKDWEVTWEHEARIQSWMLQFKEAIVNAQK